MTKLVFVYQDWTLETVPRCFYCGKGDARRLRLLVRNNRHTNIAKKYGMCRKVVLITSDNELALDYEVELISRHRTNVYAHDYVFGANFTCGGEGASGNQPSSETRRLLSELNKGKTPWNKGKKTGPRPDWVRQKIAIGHIGIKATEATKKILSESHKGIPSPMKGKKTGRPAWNHKGTNK